MIVEAVGVLVGHDAQSGVVIDQRRGIHQDAVDPAGQRRLGEARTNARGDIRHGNRTVKLSSDFRREA